MTLATNTFTGGGRCFGRARQQWGGVPEVSRRELRAYRSLARFMMYLGRAADYAMSRILDILVRICRAVKVIVQPITDPHRLLPATVVKPFDRAAAGAVLAKARNEQEKAMLAYHQDVILPASTLAVQQPAAVATGENKTISTKGMDALLTEIRNNVKAGVPDHRSQWLIGSSKRWN